MTAPLGERSLPSPTADLSQRQMRIRWHCSKDRLHAQREAQMGMREASEVRKTCAALPAPEQRPTCSNSSLYSSARSAAFRSALVGFLAGGCLRSPRLVEDFLLLRRQPPPPLLLLLLAAEAAELELDPAAAAAACCLSLSDLAAHTPYARNRDKRFCISELFELSHVHVCPLSQPPCAAASSLPRARLTCPV